MTIQRFILTRYILEMSDFGMTTETYYICDTCGKSYSKKFKCMECEASHLGITVSQLQQWRAYKKTVEDLGIVIYYCKNEENDKRYNDAIDRLLAYEKEIGIDNFNRPKG